MAEPKQVKTIKKPTLFLALLPIITMVLLLCLGYVMFELPPEPLIIASTVVAGIIAIKLGYSYNDILESISQKIAKTMLSDTHPHLRWSDDRRVDGRRHDPDDDFLRTEDH